ncbi:MAG: Fic family protein [Deltaproteobacteria bacterium]
MASDSDQDLELTAHAPPEYDEAEERRIVEQHAALTEAIHRKELRDRPLDESLVCEFHRRLFAGVRSHAGRARSPEFGSPALTYGPWRSTPKEDVPRELDACLSEGRNLIRQVHDVVDSEDYVTSAIRVALHVHARLIRIHPFEDGNGRVGRLVMSHLMVVFGLQPVAFEVPKDEYLAALNHHYEQRDLEPLVDLALELLASQLP